jgi:hypothetical protein
MSDVMILGSLLNLLSGTCRHCCCHGDSCSIGGGERCSWVHTEIERTLCNNPACQQKEFYAKQDAKRKADREAAEAARLAKIPYWKRPRKGSQWNAKRRKSTKAKGRAA